MSNYRSGPGFDALQLQQQDREERGDAVEEEADSAGEEEEEEEAEKAAALESWLAQVAAQSGGQGQAPWPWVRRGNLISVSPEATLDTIYSRFDPQSLSMHLKCKPEEVALTDV